MFKPLCQQIIPKSLIILPFNFGTLFKPFLLFLLFQIFFSFNLYCQDAEIHFTKLTTKDGLSSNTVNAILKDRYGLMWFATQDGLNKFDGTNFTVYRHRLGDSTTLQANEVFALYEDRDGNLLIGTNGGSLSLYDRQKDRFISIRSLPWARHLGDAIKAITADRSGNIWVGGYSGLSMLNLKAGRMKTFEVNPRKKGALPTEIITSIFEDHKRRIWVGTSNGLFLYNPSSDKFVPFQHTPGNPESLGGNDIVALAEDKGGKLFVGTDNGLSMLLPNGKSFYNYKFRGGMSPALSSSKTYAIASDKEGNLWIGMEDGLRVLDRKTGTVRDFFPDKRNIHSLSTKSIRSIFIDKQGIYWLGSYQGGINKYDKNLSLFGWKQSNSFDPWGLKGSVVTSFADAGAGKIYVGTDDGGLCLYDQVSGLFRSVSLKSGSETEAVQALELSKKRQLWVGTYSDGLFLIDIASNKVKHFVKGSSPDGLSSNDIFVIKEDRKGRVWIGTNGFGIDVFDPGSGTFRRFTKERGTGNTYLPLNNFIRTIEEDREGNIWVGSYGSGIASINASGQATRVFNKANSGLPSDIVLSCFVDRDNNLWVGTLGGGLSLFDRTTNRFISYTEKNGLSNNMVLKVVQDYQGRLWLSTNSGISNFDTKSKRFTNYSYHNGLQNSSFVRGAGLITTSGTIFFGGLEGFNYFNPLHLNRNKNLPQILFTDLRVSNRAISANDSEILKSHISVAKEINLDYKQSVSLSFVALNYTSPQENKYAYKLEGFDRDWNYSEDVKTATYTNLDPGEYVFHVQASNNDGVWNRKGTSIVISVKPPFWRSLYAYFFYIIIIGGTLLLLRYRTLRKLQLKFAIEQERKEVARARDLDQLKIKFLTNLSHEFRTPISLIIGPVEKLLSHHKDSATSLQLQLIGRNARRLLNLVNQLLDFRKMEENELRLNKSKGYLLSYIKEVSDSFIDVAERKKIDYFFDVRVEEIFTSFDRDKLERIIFNLLSNAFKFTLEGGKVGLVIEAASPSPSDQYYWITIKVIDSGIGIPSEKQELIFHRFFQNSISPSLINQGSGIGLSITKEFVEMHGGSISLESEPDRGSVFNLLLPFERLVPGLDHQEEQGQDREVIAEEPLVENVTDIQGAGAADLPSVLLVDDNKDFRFYLKDNLKGFYRIYEASTGSEGRQKALSKHPHLVVSDITMPEMDGIELCDKIKTDTRTKHIPVILLTAMVGEGELLKGLKTGANDYMTKPFNFEVLNSKITNLLKLQETFKDTYSKQIKIETVAPEVETEDVRLLKEVIKYIEQNLDNQSLSVEDLSRHVGMHRGTFYRKILNITGETPVEYIRSYKLEKARDLLERSDYSISQICYMVGFTTPNYFSRAFKTKFGITPTEYVSKYNDSK